MRSINHPSMPSQPAAPVVFTLLAAVLTAVGVLAFRRRDLRE